MNSNPQNIEIYHSLKKDFIIDKYICFTFLIILSCLPLFFILFYPNLLKSWDYFLIYVPISIFIALGLFLNYYYKKLHQQPILEVKFSISHSKIEIYIQNRLYFNLTWDEIEIIELLKEKYYINPMYLGRGYKLNFLCQTKTKAIRLYLFYLSKKKKKKIINIIKSFASSLNKKFLEKPTEKADKEDVFREYLQIDNYRKGKI